MINLIRMPEEFDEQIYKNQPVSNLILFSIYSLNERGEGCTFEKLVEECFKLFTKSFNFSSYPKWPDSRKLDRPLRTLRKSKFISGNPKSIFSLTKPGRRTAEEVSKLFRQKKLKFK